MLLAWGRFPVSKAIIPDAQEHFLTPSAHRDTHLFGGLGLIIENSSLELFDGKVAGGSFLIDMNRVFEQFLYVALGEALGLDGNQWRHQACLKLDEYGSISVEPDLSWWSTGQNGSEPHPRFVGDAKYKKLELPGFRHADIYQMLAYCTAADLPSGLLIYASDEGEPAEYRINHAGKTIEVAALDLSGTPEAILDSVRQLAGRVHAHVLDSPLQAVA